jgi:hypothetical protein
MVLCGLGAVFVLNPSAALIGLLTRYLVVIAVLTLLHIVITTGMDVNQGIWSVASTGTHEHQRFYNR